MDGRGRVTPFKEFGKVKDVEEWDGSDGQAVEEEEFDLDDIMNA